jgi:hypothetical protein
LRLVYPLVIWPYIKPASSIHCRVLIEFLANINNGKVVTPTIVINYRVKKWLNGEHLAILSLAESLGWNIHWVWSVETCQTWLDALATSHHDHCKQAIDNCMHFLIPADFHYSTEIGLSALTVIAQELDKAFDSEFDLILGQISTAKNEIKDLVDRLGTWRLLEIWFPTEMKLLKKMSISKPRSEFLALSGRLLENELAINQIWLPYTQTLILLLKLIHRGQVEQIRVYSLGDIKEDTPNDIYEELITQVERMERALKLYWRDRRGQSSIWIEEYIQLVKQSHMLINDVYKEALKALHQK